MKPVKAENVEDDSSTIVSSQNGHHKNEFIIIKYKLFTAFRCGHDSKGEEVEAKQERTRRISATRNRRETGKETNRSGVRRTAFIQIVEGRHVHHGLREINRDNID